MPPRVVIVGAGFAGLYCARSLARAPVAVTLVDRRNHLRSFARRQRNLDVLLGEVTAFDLPDHRARDPALASALLTFVVVGGGPNGVEVRTGAPVTAIDSGGITLGDERAPARTVLWGAGVAASPLARALGVPLDGAGRVEVALHLKGAVAWLAWLSVHILFLIGFRNRVLVVLEWAWAHATWGRGARLIVDTAQRWRLSAQDAVGVRR